MALHKESPADLRANQDDGPLFTDQHAHNATPLVATDDTQGKSRSLRLDTHPAACYACGGDIWLLGALRWQCKVCDAPDRQIGDLPHTGTARIDSDVKYVSSVVQR